MTPLPRSLPPNAELSSSSDDDDGPDSIQETHRRHSQVQELARTYTQTSAIDVGSDPSSLFNNTDENSPLNPNGPKFSARVWAKSISRLLTTYGSGFRRTGFAFQNMNVYGFGNPTDYQKDVGNVWLQAPALARRLFTKTGGDTRIDILRNFDGVVKSGEMLVVLGPPGSGCTTFLKSLSGETNGIYIDKSTYMNFQGITAEEMHTHHRAEAIYTAEVDVHFPQLSVGDTLTFASRARTPRLLPPGVTHAAFCDHYRDVVMAMYGISHTVNTRVGNEYIRGVSGGERKRVSIAEATLSNAPLQCWDNSTRGLDSANALEFCRTLRQQSELFGQTCAVSIYQAPESAYNLFDKVIVLYEGRQIFFGRADRAKEYFVNMGFECPSRQTVPDFLTSMTAPEERVVRKGFENSTPRTPDEFAARWKESAAYMDLQSEIEAYKQQYPFDGPDAEAFRQHKRETQAKSQRLSSAYMLSYWQQVKLCLWRGWRRLLGDPSITLFSLIANSILLLIVSSLFYNMKMATTSFFQRDTIIFVSILMSAFSSALEILTQYSQRPIVEKHTRYGFYHASAEAFSSVLCDLPYKITNTILTTLLVYFMTNLRREAGNYFFFLITSFLMVMAMSGLFRSVASLSRTLSQAMVPASIMMLAMIIFTGFVIPVKYMLDWCRWINYLDPVAYGFEALMINEYWGQSFPCDTLVPPMAPGYEDVSLGNRACSAVGSVPGQSFVEGSSYLSTKYDFSNGHRWRNIGVIIAMIIFNHVVHFISIEYISAKRSKGEVLVFRRGQMPAEITERKTDPEAVAPGPVAVLEKPKSRVTEDRGNFQGSTSVFHWSNVCYNVKIKKENRRILDHVDGWVKPGTLTALMGVSGAGKTTLLDCLADRISMGVITGEMLVDGKLRDSSFQRKTGYVQQQDLHLETSTVREALEFSALLRQPDTTPREEKLAYVDDVIRLLDMEPYANAVIGVLGEGLNVEQRKRLTIGVELAAKPPLLLFVDEPTSGLDSQTSWAILDLLEKLSKAGQSILCTIHQPSAMLFQRFDRLLFLAKGGRTVYFGEIGEGSKTMTSYFERQGARECKDGENPAEWMLEAIGAAPGSYSEIDWPQAWRSSPEFEEVQTELQRLNVQSPNGSQDDSPQFEVEGSNEYDEFAAPLHKQLMVVTRRVFEQYWRTPSYIYSKFAMCLSVSLFIGVVFLDAPKSIQGLQNQMFAIFQILSIFGQLTQQQMPHFVTQRSLYEVRERPSKTYSWKVFMMSQIIVEIPWNTLMSVVMFVCTYYPIGFNKNADQAGQGSERAGLMWLLFWQFLIFTCTFAHAIIAFSPNAEGGGNVANVLFSLCLLFSGVLAGPGTLPGFWIFMYRVSPFTYWISAVLSTGLANTPVQCNSDEFVHMAPANDLTCGEYLDPYISAAGGYLVDSSATEECSFCPVANTNAFLANLTIDYSHRWRDFGIGFAYIAFNICAAIFLYWLARVPKAKKTKTKKE
ncbi:hypothetical protein CC79DRAFT_1389252 [Sarocladium strictum]